MKLELDGNTVCGVYCLNYLAGQGRPMKTAEIAKAGRMGSARVRRALRALSAHGLVVRGKEGWRLAKPVGEIRVGDVEGAMQSIRASGRACRIGYEGCPYRSVCPLTWLCKLLDEEVRDLLNASSLGEFGSDLPSMPICAERSAHASRPT